MRNRADLCAHRRMAQPGSPGRKSLVPTVADGLGKKRFSDRACPFDSPMHWRWHLRMQFGEAKWRLFRPRSTGFNDTRAARALERPEFHD